MTLLFIFLFAIYRMFTCWIYAETNDGLFKKRCAIWMKNRKHFPRYRLNWSNIQLMRKISFALQTATLWRIWINVHWKYSSNLVDWNLNISSGILSEISCGMCLICVNMCNIFWFVLNLRSFNLFLIRVDFLLHFLIKNPFPYG